MLSSWTSAKSLIIAHIKCGRFRHALALYVTMLSDDSYYSPLDEPTFVALLKACTKENDPGTGFVLHAEVSRLGFLETNVFIGSALVDMYAKCGFISRSKQVFDKLEVRDVVSWTSLIAGYSEHRRGEEALQIFERMQIEGMMPNIVTFMCCLKACGDVGAIGRGAAIHAGVAWQGLVKRDNAIGNCIISMYCKCGFFHMAHEVLDDLLVHDVVSWTALITGYIEHGYNEEAIECFEQMQLEGVRPNMATMSCSLKACGSIRCLRKGLEIHEELERHGVMFTGNTSVGSLLVDMYAKCSCISEAKQVFVSLSGKVLDSWNALIGGYADHGLGKEALASFERMLCEVVSPNAVTFIYVLRACCSIGATDTGKATHVRVEENKLLDEDPTIGNTLVNMYGKCGLLILARNVFDKLIKRDVVSWTSMITSYVNCGYEIEALECFKQMKVFRVSPNLATYVCCLKAYGNIEALEEGEVMHSEMERFGLVGGDLSIGNALVYMYAKCRILTAAQGMFDRLPFRDVISWTVLIQGYAECNKTQEVLDCLQLMKLEGFSPNAFTYSCSLKACDDVDILWRLHTEIEKQGLLQIDLALGNMLISLYAKTGSLITPQQVFDRLPVQNVVSWSTIMEGYAVEGLAEKVLAYFQLMLLRGVSPDAVAFISILKACSQFGDVMKGKEIHAEVERRGFLATNSAIGNAVLKMYLRCGAFRRALQVFEKLPFRSETAWNTLMAGYAEHGRASEAFQCLEMMVQEGVSPNAFSFGYALKASDYCSANAVATARCFESLVLGRGIRAGNAMVNVYAKSGFMGEAAEAFDKLRFQDIVSWNSVITACGRHEDSESALRYFEQMVPEGVAPDVITFTGVLEACGNLGATSEGRRAHAEMEIRGLVENELAAGSAAMSMYAKWGSNSEARRVFERLPFRDVVAWTALLAGHAQIGETEQVISSFGQMLAEDIEPDSIAFLVVLSACSDVCSVHRCHTYLECMSEQYGIIPTPEHYSCLVHLHGRAGELEPAFLMAKKLPAFPNRSLLHALLDASKRSGDSDIAQQAFESTVYVV